MIAVERGIFGQSVVLKIMSEEKTINGSQPASVDDDHTL
jgi:hypothetical protein